MLARLLVVLWAWVLVSGCGAEPEAAPPTSRLTKPAPTPTPSPSPSSTPADLPSPAGVRR